MGDSAAAVTTAQSAPERKQRPPRNVLAKYDRVREPEVEKPDVILVLPARNLTPYVTRATHLLQGNPDDAEATKYSTIELKGTGKAVAQVVQLVEVLKRRIRGLHQVTTLESSVLTSVYKKKEGVEDEDLEPVLKFERAICGISIQISLDELDKTKTGYQAPLPESVPLLTDEELKALATAPPSHQGSQRHGNKRSRRGARNSGKGRDSSAQAGSRNGRGGRGGGGRGRGGRGGGRGGNANRGGRGH